MLLVALFWYGGVKAESWDEIGRDFKSQNKMVSSLEHPGFTISVSNADEIVLQMNSGSADIEQSRLIDNNTVFHIASLSKQITGAALAHAILESKISLEDVVSDWLPETKKFGSKLKVKHLVFMTSGLIEYTAVPRADKKPWATFHYFSTHDAINASLSVDELQFEPGSEWQYSNINYMLITELVAKAYGKPFSAVVQEKIFLPLEMRGSLVNDDITQVIPNRANAYLERSQPVLNELKHGAKIHAGSGSAYAMIRRNSPHFGGSGVMTSMNDWMKWQREIITHKLFGEKFWDIMLSTMKFNHEKVNDSFGLVHGNVSGEPTLWYEGGDIDGSSYSVTFLNQKLNISCFGNNPVDSCKSKVEALMKMSGKFR
jgi:CubicO group peptidase (beta-lactamase class C family)